MLDQITLDFSYPDDFQVFVGDLNISPAVVGGSLALPRAKVDEPLIWRGRLNLAGGTIPALAESLDDSTGQNPARWAPGNHPVRVFMNGENLPWEWFISNYTYRENEEGGSAEMELTCLLGLLDGYDPPQEIDIEIGAGTPESEVCRRILEQAGNIDGSQKFAGFSLPSLPGVIKAPVSTSGKSLIREVQQRLGERGYWLYIMDDRIARAERYPFHGGTVARYLHRGRVETFEKTAPDEKLEPPVQEFTVTGSAEQIRDDLRPNPEILIEERFNDAGVLEIARRTTIWRNLTPYPQYMPTLVSGFYPQQYVEQQLLEIPAGDAYPSVYPDQTWLVQFKFMSLKRLYDSEGKIEFDAVAIYQPLATAAPQVGIISLGLGGSVANTSPVLVQETLYKWLYLNGLPYTREYKSVQPARVLYSQQGATSATLIEAEKHLDKWEVQPNQLATYTHSVYRCKSLISEEDFPPVSGGSVTAAGRTQAFDNDASEIQRDISPEQPPTYPEEYPLEQIGFKATRNFVHTDYSPLVPKKDKYDSQTLDSEEEAGALAELLGTLRFQRYNGHLISRPMGTFGGWKPFEIETVHTSTGVVDGLTLTFGDDGVERSYVLNEIGVHDPIPEPPPPIPQAGGTALTMLLPSASLTILQGQPFSLTLTASGGTAPYTWSTSGLPAGLSRTGAVISGTPTSLGASTVSVGVTDSSPQSISGTLGITVIAVPAPSIPILISTDISDYQGWADTVTVGIVATPATINDLAGWLDDVTIGDPPPPSAGPTWEGMTRAEWNALSRGDWNGLTRS